MQNNIIIINLHIIIFKLQWQQMKKFLLHLLHDYYAYLIVEATIYKLWINY